MDTNIGLWSVFVINLCIVFTVSIVQKGMFVIQKDERIAAHSYGAAIRNSTVECAMICLHSENCTGANYLPETRTCYLFNQTCFGTEDAPDWTYLRQPQANRTFLYISNQTLPWDGAKSYCESIGGGLANVLTTADQEMILSILNQYGNPLVWVAGSDKEKEGEWVWSNGCRFDDQDFSFWIPGQPSNWLGIEHCLQLKYLQWNDEYCAKSYTFVCEIIVA